MVKRKPVADDDGFRRFRLRLSVNRKDEADFMASLDDRNEVCGGIDHDYIRRCLLLGFVVMQQAATNAERLDTYTNNSQYTPIDTKAASDDPKKLAEPLVEIPAKGSGDGVRSLLGLLGSNPSAREVSA